MSDDSNYTTITLVKFDAFPLKNIVDSDLSNARKFDNLGDPSVSTTATFDLTVDNVSDKPLYFTLYDYFENESLGLSANQRRRGLQLDEVHRLRQPGRLHRHPGSARLGLPEFFNGRTGGHGLRSGLRRQGCGHVRRPIPDLGGSRPATATRSCAR